MDVIVPNSTSLRWVPVDSDGTVLTGSLPVYTNRLQQHWTDVPNSEIFEKFLKFITGDIVKTQFTTDASAIVIKVYDQTDDSVASTESGNEVSVHTYSTGLEIYNLNIDTSSLGAGKYYIRMEFDATEYYQSEYFEVAAFSTDETVKIEWASSDRLGVYNPLEVYGTYYFRLDARFYKIGFGDDKKTYVDSDYEFTLQDGAPILTVTLELGETPFFIAEKLVLALQHKMLKINGVDFQTEDSASLEVIQSNAYTTGAMIGTVELRKKEYEVFADSVDTDIPETYIIEYDHSENALEWSSDNKLLWK